jgi:hypothetical protein
MTFSFDTGADGGTVTYAYATSSKGGSADLYLDGSLARSVTFAAGSVDRATKTISVPVVRDASYEAPETFSIGLTSANGAAIGATASTMVTILNVAVTSDFDGDGNPDFVWQNTSTDPTWGGRQYVWTMVGTTLSLSLEVLSSETNGPLRPGPGWEMRASGDFDGDAKPDLVWQGPSGELAVWLMDATDIKSSGTLWFTSQAGSACSQACAPQTNGTYSKVVGSADMNGDGVTDLVFQDPVTGRVLIWTMDSANRTKQASELPIAQSWAQNPGPNWKVVAVIDMNWDAVPDLVWQDNTGALAAWNLDANQFVIATPWFVLNQPADPAWTVVGAADIADDVLGVRDGFPDLVLRKGGTGSDAGTIAIWYMSLVPDPTPGYPPQPTRQRTVSPSQAVVPTDWQLIVR